MIARAPDKPKKAKKEPQIAYLDGNAICISEYSKDIINNLMIY